MIDYFFKFTNEAAAIADASGTIYYTPPQTFNGVTTPGSWNADRVAPGIQVWRASQDVAGSVIGPGGVSVPTVTHTFLAGWFGIISIPIVKAALMNHSALQIAMNRELAAAGQAAILKNNLGALLQDLRFSPVFAGSNYPFGNLI